MHKKLHLSFVVDLAAVGLFKVLVSSWEALRASTKAILNSKAVRVQARKLASLMGIEISTKPA
jgi:hypothetical protein